VAVANADEHTSTVAPADKSVYHLFNPTPRELMREMSTDRPDTTESPFTVDAGHFQLEMSFVDYTHDDRNRDSSRVETLTFGAMNLKAGLLNNVDLQLVFDAYVHDRTHDQAAMTSDTEEGFGDTQVRLKWNLWGNDPAPGSEIEPGDTALALMPFVKFPTADDDLGNEHVEGGLIVPLAIELPAGFGMGLMAEFDAVYDDGDGDYDLDFVHTATVSHDLIGDLGGYVEYIGIASTDSPEYAAIVGAGLTYGLTANIQLDAGVNFGLTTPADDINAFVGVSVRY
jgi:hypothetical protein